MDAADAFVMNVALVAVSGVVFLVVLGAAFRPSSGYRRAGRWAERARLPLDPAPLRHSVVARFRTLEIADAAAMVAGAAIAGVFLTTGLADSRLFFLVVAFPALLLARLAATVIVSVRERLFRPAPEAPRIARAHAMCPADYLGPVRRGMTWALAAAAVAALLVLIVCGSDLGAGAVVMAIGALLLAFAVCIALPPLERLVLAQPQPTSDTVELAWDDALRSDALATLRLTVGVALVVGIGAVIVVVWDDDEWRFFAASQLVLWGQLTLQLVYPTNGFALRPPLRPQEIAGMVTP